MMALLRPAFALFRREVVRFLRQPNRIVGALGTPIVFWLLIGSGLRDTMRIPTAGDEINYLQYFFPGTIVLIILFTAIFSTISLIEDRREGFLQGVLVAPVPRAAIVLGNLFGGTALATLQGLLFLALAPFLGLPLSVMEAVKLTALMAVLAFGLTGLGFIMAWRLNSSQGFHALMNLFLMPMWLLSGALFPVATAPVWLRVVMRANPLSYGLSALQSGLFGGVAAGQPSFGTSLAVTVAFAGAMFAAAWQTAAGKARS